LQTTELKFDSTLQASKAFVYIAERFKHSLHIIDYRIIVDSHCSFVKVCVSHCSRFEQLAIKVLGKCYQRDKEKTHKLLVRKLRSWQDRTLLSIAGGERQMDFLGQTACKTKLNYIWRGKITGRTTKFKVRDCVLYLYTVSRYGTFSTQKTLSNILHISRK
jgi:hypothetical protein